VVRPWSCRVIYYFDTPALGIRHHSFDRVKFLASLPGNVNYCINYIFYFIVFSFLSFYLTFVCFVLFCFVSFFFSFLFFSSILFSSYTCMRVWSCTLSGRLFRASSSSSENMVEEDNQSLHNENNVNNRVRTLRDHINLTRTSALSCIIFPPDASRFNFKPDIIQVLPTFHGLDLENPYLYLREFEEVCNICSMNVIRLKLFPFLLKDKAKIWLQNLRPRSIRA